MLLLRFLGSMFLVHPRTGTARCAKSFVLPFPRRTPCTQHHRQLRNNKHKLSNHPSLLSVLRSRPILLPPLRSMHRDAAAACGVCWSSSNSLTLSFSPPPIHAHTGVVGHPSLPPPSLSAVFTRPPAVRSSSRRLRYASCSGRTRTTWSSLLRPWQPWQSLPCRSVCK